jgi:hypothetical protein
MPGVGLGRTLSVAPNADTALARLDIISKSSNKKWGSWALATKIQQTGKPALAPGLGARPRGRAGLVCHWGRAPVARVWNHVVSGTPLLRYISRLYYMQNLASFP